MQKILNNFKNQRILVVGDLILDEYRHCDSLGKSAESPTIVVKETSKEQYIGGAGVIALHLKELGCTPIFVSVVGNDSLGKDVFNVLHSINMESLILFDNDRETTLKIRYISEAHKLLRISHLTERLIGEYLETEILNRIKLIHKTKKLDGIIISDFNYGVITPRILNTLRAFAKKNKIKIFGDSQTSSQYGDIKKLNGFTMITPNEVEARRALGDNYSDIDTLASKLLKMIGVESIFITLGKHGVYAKNAKQSVKLPAFGDVVKEKMGCGDALLSCAALALCSGATIKQAAFLGSCMASIKVSEVGNVPIGIEQLKVSINKYKGDL